MGVVNGYSVEPTKGFDFKSYYCCFDVKKAGKYAYNISISRSPTGNCQLISIGWIYHLFLMQTTRADATAIVQECCRFMGITPLLIAVDVRLDYASKVEECFTVIKKIQYMNTNGNDMCFFLMTL